MKKTIQLVFSFSLIMLVLFSTVGFTVSKHICGGEVVLTAVGFSKKELSCGMEKKKTKCPHHKSVKEPCCSNEFELHQLEENFKDITSVPLPTQLKMAVVDFKTVSIKTFEVKKVPTFCFESPPVRIQDFQILFQSMLI